MTGKNVTVETICFKMFRISAWISASGFAGALMPRLSAVNEGKGNGNTYGSEASVGGSTRLISNTHRSRVVLESFDMMASTNCVTEPVRSHSA